MFQKTRLTLTAWYALISLFITMLFSVAIYTNINSEFQRFEHLQEIIRKRAEYGIPTRLPHDIPLSRLDSNAISEARTRLIVTLIVINGAILGIATGAGYFLAGRTLRPIQKMVDEQNRFVTDASHELRTPITSLRSEIEVNLRNKKLTLKDAHKLLKSNLEEVVDLQNISNNLLELAQLGKPQSITHFTDVSIPEVFDQALKKITGNIKKKEITLEKKIDDVTISGIPERLTELFVILLDNAVKYSPEKSTINISAQKKADSIEIKVADNGMGISEQDLPYIFDRFYRVSKSRSKEKIHGYGLGLSIAKKIVEQHGGTMSAESKPGNGTVIIVLFR